ncbi:hypothetical protein [Geoglobus acetivorans]|uniref:Uncharacterized protein n=1 Tax=Geoglobus acetivorans TaxID=565033 RepID=A0ABZ3H4W5_GEOAI|nr:hypothetical protein [Geoglobus acetivorans]
MKRTAALLLFAVLVIAAGFTTYSRIISVNEPSQKNSEKLPKMCETSSGQIKYGTPPDFKSEEDRQEWLAKLDSLGESIKKNGLLDRYFHPIGPVVSYGYDYSGYFVISLENCSKVEKHELDGIYEVISREAEKLGMANIPVLFRFEGVPVAE